MNVVAAVGADQQPAAVVEPGEGALDDPAVAPEARAVIGVATCDDGPDAAPPDQPTVLVVVVAAVGDQPFRSSSWSADTTAHRRHPVEEPEQLRDVVAVGAGERPGERDAAAVYE